MIVKKLKCIPSIYTDKAHITFECGAYDLHVIKFQSNIRVFLKGQFLVYEAQKNTLELSNIIGLLSWLDSDRKTAKYYIDNKTEIIKMAWYDKLPSVKIKFNS